MYNVVDVDTGRVLVEDESREELEELVSEANYNEAVNVLLEVAKCNEEEITVTLCKIVRKCLKCDSEKAEHVNGIEFVRRLDRIL